MERKYTNYAFISYKREDEKWAKWIQHKLENYRLPAVARNKETDERGEKYIRPVFRDGTDLSGGVLIDRLREELMNSRYLIIICSPHATRSEWVNKEAQTFIDEGRMTSIIPFIVDGKPHASDPGEECFPQALRDIPAEQELLGINVREVGRSMAFVRLVATMLNVRFDTLWQRHRRSQLRRRVLAGAAAVLILLSALFVWDYNRPTYAYFADYVDCWGVPRGIVPLTTDQVRHRHESYQFEYRRIPFGQPGFYSWRIARVSNVNSALRPVAIAHSELNDRYPVQEIEYNEESGLAARINFCDAYGNVQLRHVLAERNGQPAAIADFVDAQESRGTGFAAIPGLFAENRKSVIVRYAYERDPNGYVVRQTYHSNNDYQLTRSAASDAEGIFGRQFTLDSLGRRLKVEYLGPEGEKTCTRQGIAGKEYAYGEQGTLVRTTTFDLAGRPIEDNQAVATAICKTDACGNIVERQYYNARGKLCLNRESYATIRITYDDSGQMTEYAYFDTLGRPCQGPQGVEKVRSRYDRRGNEIERWYLDADGNPMQSHGDKIRVAMKYDKYGNMTEERYLDEQGNLREDLFGMAMQRGKYNSRHECLELVNYGPDGRPASCGIAFTTKVTIGRDNHGNITEWAFFDADGKRELSFQQYAIMRIKYDERDNPVEWTYFDADEKPCGIEGTDMAVSRAKYDERGNMTEMSYYGTNGQLTMNQKEGYAIGRYKYDEQSRCIELAFFGADDKPCGYRNSPYSVERRKYDERGNRIEAAYFDTEGRPVIGKTVWQYDRYGNVTEERVYDTDGRRRLQYDTYFRRTYRYDRLGNVIETAFYGTDDRPIAVPPRGTFRIEMDYANYNEETAARWYDVRNQLVADLIIGAEITDVDGAAAEQGVVPGSYILQMGKWTLGMSYEALNRETDRTRFTEKDFYCLTPDDEIRHYHFDKNTPSGIVFEKARVERRKNLPERLEQWKKTH